MKRFLLSVNWLHHVVFRPRPWYGQRSSSQRMTRWRRGIAGSSTRKSSTAWYRIRLSPVRIRKAYIGSASSAQNGIVRHRHWVFHRIGLATMNIRTARAAFYVLFVCLRLSLGVMVLSYFFFSPSLPAPGLFSDWPPTMSISPRLWA